MQLNIALKKHTPFSPVTNLSTEGECIRHHIFLYGNKRKQPLALIQRPQTGDTSYFLLLTSYFCA
jgi:hypothetical protein